MKTKSAITQKILICLVSVFTFLNVCNAQNEAHKDGAKQNKQDTKIVVNLKPLSCVNNTVSWLCTGCDDDYGCFKITVTTQGHDRAAAEALCREQITTGSIIDNNTYNYIHKAKDYAPNASSPGCSSCSGASAGSKEPELVISHDIRPRQNDYPSSLGSIVYSNFDKSLNFFKDANGNLRADFYTNELLAKVRFYANGDYLYETVSQTVKHMQLFDGTGAVTRNIEDAEKAVITSRDNTITTFEIFELDALNCCGRLVSSVNPRGCRGSGVRSRDLL